MAIRGGYRGKLLEVDLTHGTVASVPLPSEDVLRRWVGCTGLGLYLLSREITPDMRPTDPECPVFLVTGPLTGTLAPNGCNWAIVSLNGNLPDHVGISQTHGYWGARLKHAGWDGVILRGASSRPAYLWIDDDRVELRDAAPYWGQDIFETTRRIQGDLGDTENVSVACIGPGGENLLPGGSVRCDLAYGCNKGAPGTLWGAKKLKAIAVRGTGKVPIAEPAAFTELLEQWNRLLKEHRIEPEEARGLRVMPEFAAKGSFPGKNYSDPEYAANWGKRLAKDMAQWKIKPVGSWQCEHKCHHETTITTGPMAGCQIIGYAGEIIEAVGPNLGVEDPGVALALCGMLDGLGLDCAEVPRTIAAVMDAYNRGVLTLEDTDGLDLAWGNYDAIVELINKTVRREGIGAVLAKGLRPATRELGIEDFAVHIKGVGFGDHDIRAHGARTVFQCLISGAGPTWQTTLRDGGWFPQPDVGIYEAPSPDTPEGKGDLTYRTQMLKMWEDTLGLCLFAVDAGISGIVDVMVRAVRSAIGWSDFASSEALTVGERVINLQRLIVLYRGYDPKSEFDISPRMLEVVPSGPARGRGGLGPHLARVRADYYRCLGWDPDTGQPGEEALRKVGLSGYKVGKV